MKPTTQLSYLRIRWAFKSGLHLSRGRPARDQSQDAFRSDTLKSAFFAALVQLGENPSQDFLNLFQISSAFPFVGAQDFFPLPLLGAKAVARDMQNSKLLKKLRYVEKSLFERLILGSNISLEKEQLIDAGRLAISKSTQDEYPVFSRGIRQQVTLREVPDDPYGFANPDTPTPYFMEELRWQEGAGLWAMIMVDRKEKSEVMSSIRTVLRFLEDEGMGAARSRGLGQFTATLEEMELTIPKDPTHYMAMGLYCPARQALNEDLLEGGAWELIRRDGYIASSMNSETKTLRRPSIHMLAEGTVFPGKIPQGVCLDLWPETNHGVSKPHPVWRDGRPVWIPLHFSSPQNS